MITRNYLLLAGMFILTACGGGGGGGSDPEPPKASSNTTTTTTINTTSDLTTTPQFEFNSDYQLQLDLLGQNSGTSIFVNVCSAFESSSKGYEIDYASCKLRTYVGQNSQRFELTLSASETKLLAQFWRIEDGAEPVNVIWERGSNDRWTLSYD